MGINLLASKVSVLPQNLGSEIMVQWDRYAGFLNHIEVVQGSGINCAFVAEFEAAVARSFDDGYLIQDAEYDSDNQVIASVPWARLRSPKGATGLLVDAAASTQGAAAGSKAQLPSLIRSGSAAIVKKAGFDSVNGTTLNNKDLLGIAYWLKTSGTVAGIDLSVTANADFKSNIIPVGGALTAAALGSGDTAVYKRNQIGVDAFQMHPDLADKYSNLFVSNQRYGGDEAKYGAGAPLNRLFFRDKPIILNTQMSTSEVHCLSFDSWKLMVLPKVVVKGFSFITQEAVNQSGNHLKSTVARLPINVTPVESQSGSVYKYDVESNNMQLICTHPKRNAVLTGVT